MNAAEFLAQLPPEWPESLQASNRKALLQSDTTLVVLDDDPTGTQTVHDVPVLTTWNQASLEQILREAHPLVFLLTNSRSLTGPETAALHKQIAIDLGTAMQASGRRVELISRSDSTLRGHFPLETDTLAQNWPKTIDLILVMPFFLEGGRLTIDGQHYVQEGEKLVPAHETPFARDAVFGFTESFLPRWVEEKTAGRVPAEEVVVISLETVRTAGPKGVLRKLREAPKGAVCAVDSVTDRDAEVVAAAVAAFQDDGGRIMARTAASYVRARAGLQKRALLEREDLVGDGRGGLVVIGSHVPKTTAQLEHLVAAYPDLVQVELSVSTALEDAPEAVRQTVEATNAALSDDRDVVVFTSRDLVEAESADKNLRISGIVSNCLVEVVRSLEHRPRFMVAKGGITSSDIATKGLEVKAAAVAGSILPGVPVWRLGPEARFPGLPYIIFPGNVGGLDALAEAVAKLTNS